MSILIKGMEMPTSCHECVAGYGGCCFVAPAEADGICPDHGRADFCPLVSVPKHGRMIDSDALIKELTLDDEDDNSGASLLMAIFLEVLKAAPTFIEAEEGE